MKKWLLIGTLPTLIVAGFLTANLWAHPQGTVVTEKPPTSNIETVEAPVAVVEEQPVIETTPSPQTPQDAPETVSNNPYGWSDSDWSCVQKIAAFLPVMFSRDEIDRSNDLMKKVITFNTSRGVSYNACTIHDRVVTPLRPKIPEGTPWPYSFPSPAWKSQAMLVGDMDLYGHYSDLEIIPSYTGNE